MAELLARAFRDDPAVVWVHSREDERHSALAKNFHRMLVLGRHSGRMDLPDDETGGIAVWFNMRGPRVRLPIALRLSYLALPFRLGPLPAVRYAAMMSAFDRYHANDVPDLHEPHWYLAALGVEPERQGRGTGSRLLARGLEEADDQDLPCYLETTHPRNVEFYRRHGFDIVREGSLPLAGPRFWTMLRWPR
jgi:GNAT superfamily N-acetyltransferase